MKIETSRFGSVAMEADDILLFPHGVASFEHLRHFVILADADNDAVGWLQSVSDAQTALAVVSPRRFVADYQVRVAASELAALQLAGPDRTFVLAVVSKQEGRLTINLRAPIVINLDRRLGRQVITKDDQPLRYEIAAAAPAPLRKSA
jgi:flagellar assembly factor FliW